MSDPSKTIPDPEPFRIPDGDLDDLASALAKTIAEVRQHGVILDRLGAEPTPAPVKTQPTDEPATAGDANSEAEDGPTSVFILALGDEAYAVELAALSDWVNYLFLPVYGREISTTRPWCAQWHEHPEAVARLHALWLAWQQLTDAEAGLSALEAGRIDALVYDRPLLLWLVRERYSDSLRVLNASFDPQYYAIALPEGSKLRVPIDLALLDVVRSEWWQETVSGYLGQN